MHYKESKDILDLIKNNNKFVLFCHESPDLDSVISCLSLQRKLEEMNKSADIVSVDKIDNRFKFLKSIDTITHKNPDEINFNDYDVMIIPDASEFRRVGINKIPVFDGTVVNIDHHEDENRIGDIKVVNTKSGATCGIIFNIFRDWNLKLGKQDIDDLLLGMVADTGVFHYSIYSSSYIFRIVSEMIDLGGDYDRAVFYADQCYSFEMIKFLGEAIKNIKINKAGKFSYIIMPYKTIKKYKSGDRGSRFVIDKILRNINDTDFAVIIMEKKNGNVKVSARTRTPGFYVLDFIKQLGGGGHLTGGGSEIETQNFNETCKMILDLAEKYAKKHRKNN